MPRSGRRTATELLPGPGAYSDPVSAFTGKGVSAFSRAPRDAKRATDAPGVGQYEAPSSTFTRGVGFPRAPRRFQPDSAAPGPGAYETRPASASLRGPTGIGRAPRFTPAAAAGPGPGAYEGTKSALDSRGIVMGKASGHEVWGNRAPSPGPGSYEAPVAPKRTGPASFGRSSRPASATLSPGPGAYDGSAAAGPSRPKAPVFSTAPRFVEKQPPLPGPGAYEAPRVGASGGVAFPRAQRREASQPVPGPGSYESGASTFATRTLNAKLAHQAQVRAAR